MHFTDCLPLVTFLQEQFRYKTSYHLLNSQDQNYFITKLIADYLLSHFVAFYELSNAPLFIPVQIVLVLSFLYFIAFILFCRATARVSRESAKNNGDEDEAQLSNQNNLIM